ncbi:histidine phosphatase family protein [Sphingomonas sp.]|uniref:histidine phosphatase family protein n=1 Tax=Sphingomonas sp. TaxID=28214 RepID=UPI0035BBA1B3
MATDFLLIRHAAHVHLDRLLSGRLDGVPLSAAGRDQAARLGARLARERVDRAMCSPLERTRETADAIAAACGLRAEPVAALVEIDMGEWTGRAMAELDGDPAWDAWNARRGTARIPGGETMRQAQARIVGALGDVAREADGQTVAVVSHSDMIRAAVAHVLGLSLDHLLRFDIAPASVTRVVWGDWGARLVTLNVACA